MKKKIIKNHKLPVIEVTRICVVEIESIIISPGLLPYIEFNACNSKAIFLRSAFNVKAVSPKHKFSSVAASRSLISYSTTAPCAL